MTDEFEIEDIQDNPSDAIIALVESASYLESCFVRLLESDRRVIKERFSDEERGLLCLSSQVVEKWRDELGLPK